LPGRAWLELPEEWWPVLGRWWLPVRPPVLVWPVLGRLDWLVLGRAWFELPLLLPGRADSPLGTLWSPGFVEVDGRLLAEPVEVEGFLLVEGRALGVVALEPVAVEGFLEVLGLELGV